METLPDSKLPFNGETEACPCGYANVRSSQFEASSQPIPLEGTKNPSFRDSVSMYSMGRVRRIHRIIVKSVTTNWEEKKAGNTPECPQYLVSLYGVCSTQ